MIQNVLIICDKFMGCHFASSRRQRLFLVKTVVTKEKATLIPCPQVILLFHSRVYWKHLTLIPLLPGC